MLSLQAKECVFNFNAIDRNLLHCSIIVLMRRFSLLINHYEFKTQQNMNVCICKYSHLDEEYANKLPSHGSFHEDSFILLASSSKTNFS